MKNVLFLLLQIIHYCLTASSQPHIIYILADDLGWNDVGFHGSGEIRTPNIDALAYSGLILNNYYVNPICTPSRSALMTGKYPIHTGMQHGVLYGAEPRGLSLEEKLLPQYLQELGYTNHILGKWHLGSWKKEYTPTFRGFKSHLGCWTGHQDYNDHTAMERGMWGLDMHRNMEVAYDVHGNYTTDIIAQESQRIINEHNPDTPLFLYLAHVATHSGNPYNFLPAPDGTVKKFSHIKNYERQRFAAILSKLDDSVGVVVKTLASKNMLNNSIIIFSTDNGGPAAGFNQNAASNFPLKGVKNTLWEGGVRGAGLIWSTLIKQAPRVAKQLIHMTDWLPTLLAAAGGSNYIFKNIDGMNMWDSLSEDSVSPRHEILLNIDDIEKVAAVRVGSYKLVKGSTYNGNWDYWYGPSGRDIPYNESLIQSSVAAKALASTNKPLIPEMISKLRQEAEVKCMKKEDAIPCKPLEALCLFNIDEDPCEYNNIAANDPDTLQSLKTALDNYNVTVVPPKNMPLDPRGNPKYWNYVYTTFGDEENKEYYNKINAIIAKSKNQIYTTSVLQTPVLEYKTLKS